MSDCGWCGKEIIGKPVLSETESSVLIRDGGNSVIELIPEFVEYFCCNGCAWAFSAEAHRLMGLSGKDLRTHLIDMHKFSYPPGKPAGGMRRDCMVVGMAQSLALLFKS